MSKYVFIGSESDIGDISLRSFGQHVELTDELAREAVLGGCAILPVADFESIGFEHEEIKKFAKPGPRADAPAEFQTKMHAALLRLHELREAANG